MNVLLIGNDQTIRVNAVKNEVTGAFINSATVTARILDNQGDAVEGETWPITLSYVAASDGNYIGTFEDGVELEEGEVYTVEVTADGGTDLKGFWRFHAPAEYRQP